MGQLNLILLITWKFSSHGAPMGNEEEGQAVISVLLSLINLNCFTFFLKVNFTEGM